MCGRYRLSRRKQIIEEHFDSASGEDDDWSPRYNIAPTQPVSVILQHPKEPLRQLSLMKWGSHSTLVERPVYRDKHDQREIGDGRYETSVPRCVEISEMPDPSRCVLRVEAHGEVEAALLL